MAQIMINENLSTKIAIGPDYLFVIGEDLPPYHSFGIEGQLSFDYKLTPCLKVNLGISAQYNPFTEGDLYKTMNDEIFGTMFVPFTETSDYTYSINPTLGVSYSF